MDTAGKPGTKASGCEHSMREEDPAVRKIYGLHEYDELKKTVGRWRAAGERIVTTNGCFDILHRGHIKLINQARAMGDRLIVAINADASVKRLKGEGRPLNNENDRSYVMASMEAADVVVLFDPGREGHGPPPEDLLRLRTEARKIATEAPMYIMRLIRPDIHVKGSDYEPGLLPEAIYASELYLAPLEAGYSTTTIIERINRCGG